MRWLMLGLWACRGGDSDTEVGADPDPDAAPAVIFLVGGDYESTAMSVENDTCGSFLVDSGLLPILVVRTSQTTFELRYPEGTGVSTATCTMDGPDVTCTGWVQNVDPFTITSVTESFVITENWSFDLRWSWTLTCAGTKCDGYATQFETTFPCTVDVIATFETEH